jgi:hypothetical protein
MYGCVLLMPGYTAKDYQPRYHSTDTSLSAALFYKVLNTRKGDAAKFMNVLSHGYRWYASEDYGNGEKLWTPGYVNNRHLRLFDCQMSIATRCLGSVPRRAVTKSYRTVSDLLFNAWVSSSALAVDLC